MVQPRQVIYPFRFFTSWLAGDDRAEPDFVAKMKRFLGPQNAVIPLGRARTGIYLLAKAVVTRERPRVIMSPYTIADIVNMVRFAGGEPVFVDFAPKSTNVDLGHLQTLIDERTACVLLTHYHVVQERTAEIAELCRAKGAALFDDCALALGASLAGQPVGTLTDGSVFSMSGFKILNFFWGGAVTSRRADLTQKIAAEVAGWPPLRMHQYATQALKVINYSLATNPMIFPLAFRVRRSVAKRGKVNDIFAISRIETRSLDETILSRPSPSAVAEWNRKFGEIAKVNAHRRSIAAIYDETFRPISVSSETDDAVRASSSFVNYPIVVGRAHRDRIYRESLRRGFDVGLSLYSNVHEMAPYAAIEGKSTNVSDLIRSIITLPTHVRITPDYARQLASAVAELLPRE